MNERGIFNWDVQIRLEMENDMERTNILNMFQNFLETRTDLEKVHDYIISVKIPPRPPEPDSIEFRRVKEE